MPLTTRNVSPVDLSVNRLDPSVKKDELLCIANGTLANLIRQLSSLSRNAEQLFSEVHRDVLKIDHRANTLVMRIERLAQKVSHPDTRSNPGNLEENMARKAFKSYNPIDQHSLDRQTLPNSLHNLYLKCDSPPHLDQLNPYRDDPKSALRYYTDPSYFFDLWKQEILKECAADGGDKRGRLPPQEAAQAVRGGSGRSPLRRRRQPQQQSPHAQGMIYYQSSSILQQLYYHPPQANAAHQVLQFPVEYQAPQHAMHSMMGSHHHPVQPPPGMSLHVNSNGSGVVGAVENIRVVGHPSTAATTSYHHQQSAGPPYHVAPQSQHQQGSGLAGLSARVGGIVLGNAGESALPTNIEALLDEDEDDELPPPPPILSSQQYGVLGASSSSAADVKSSSDTSLRNSASNNNSNNHQQGSTPMDGTLLTRPTGHGGTILQYLPSGQHHANVQPAPIPTPSVPPTSDTAVMVASVTVASFSATKVLGGVNGHDGIAAIDADEDEDNVDNNGIGGEELKNEEPKASNLLMEIQSGIKLKKVQRLKEMEEVKSATESNDVAAILRRRMEHVLGCNDESSESSNSNDGEWD